MCKRKFEKLKKIREKRKLLFAKQKNIATSVCVISGNFSINGNKVIKTIKNLKKADLLIIVYAYHVFEKKLKEKKNNYKENRTLCS